MSKYCKKLYLLPVVLLAVFFLSGCGDRKNLQTQTGNDSSSGNQIDVNNKNQSADESSNQGKEQNPVEKVHSLLEKKK